MNPKSSPEKTPVPRVSVTLPERDIELRPRSSSGSRKAVFADEAFPRLPSPHADLAVDIRPQPKAPAPSTSTPPVLFNVSFTPELITAVTLGFVWLGTLVLFLKMPVAGVALAALPLLYFLTQKYYDQVLVLLFASFPFQQPLLNGAAAHFSLVDIIAAMLVLVLPVMARKRGGLRMGPVSTPFLLFFGIAFLSSALGWAGMDCAVSLARMLMATVVAVAIFGNTSPSLGLHRKCFMAYLAATGILSIFTMLAFASGGIQASMYTLNIQKNALGPTYGSAIVVALALIITTNYPVSTRRKPLSPRRKRHIGREKLFLYATLTGSVVGIILSLSRGAWVATAAGILVLLLTTRNLKAFVIAVTVSIPLVSFLWARMPKEATEYASNVSTSALTVQTRFAAMELVMKNFRASPIIGKGVGLRKWVEPHNVLVLTLGETGVMGLVAFAYMFLAAYIILWRAARAARGNTLATQLVITGATVLTVTLVHGLMDVYWRRGVGFMGWAAVGMAVNILRLATQQNAVPATLAEMTLRHPAQNGLSTAGVPALNTGP